ELARDVAGAARLDDDPEAAIVRHQRVREREVAAAGRHELDAVGGVIADDAVREGQRLAGIEHEPGAAAEAAPLDGETAQADGGRRGRVDGDAGGAGRHQDAGLAPTSVDDADGPGGRHAAPSARI